MENSPDLLPDDVAALRAELIAARAKGAQIEAELAVAKAKASDDLAVIARQKLRIEKLERQLCGPKAERRARLIDQMEFPTGRVGDGGNRGRARCRNGGGGYRQCRRLYPQPAGGEAFPDHPPRERVVVPGPVSCQCCGGDRLRKLGEDVAESLEVVPRQWKVIQTVCEKFTCRDCEKISQAPAPFHAMPRGWAGPNLLAMILFDRFGQHLPLNRQVERFEREGVSLSLSTVADSIGACCAVLDPIIKRIEAHTFAAERLQGDDATVPVLAARPISPEVGSMCAMIDRSAGHSRTVGDVLLFA